MGRDPVRIVGVADGDAIVVDGMDAPKSEGGGPADGTLSAPVEVAEWVGEAVAAGITFDVLKGIAADLVRHGWKKQPGEVTAESVSAAVTAYLTSVGYQNVVVTQVRKIPERGWSVTGTVGSAGFRSMADPDGHVIHVRVR